MALSQKQLEALSTLTGPAALDGTLRFDDVLQAVLLLMPEGQRPRVFTDKLAMREQVVIGIADVARLLLAQGEHIEALRDEVAEWRSGKCSDDNKYVEVKTIAEDLRSALAYETGHCGGDIDDDGHYQELGERCRQALGPVRAPKPATAPETDPSLPPESLDGRTQPVDPTERDPVEVSTFGVGSISPEAEAMRRGVARQLRVGDRVSSLDPEDDKHEVGAVEAISSDGSRAKVGWPVTGTHWANVVSLKLHRWEVQ